MLPGNPERARRCAVNFNLVFCLSDLAGPQMDFSFEGDSNRPSVLAFPYNFVIALAIREGPA